MLARAELAVLPIEVPSEFVLRNVRNRGKYVFPTDEHAAVLNRFCFWVVGRAKLGKSLVDFVVCHKPHSTRSLKRPVRELCIGTAIACYGLGRGRRKKGILLDRGD